MKAKSDQISLLSDAMEGSQVTPIRNVPIAQRKPVYPRHGSISRRGVESVKKSSPRMSSSASLALLKASQNHLYKLREY